MGSTGTLVSPPYSLRLSSYPEGELQVDINGAWAPVCGHYFWNNDIGAGAACQSMGYASGTVIKSRHTLSEPGGLYIGECSEDEQLGRCSRGGGERYCPRNSVGGCGRCEAGEPAGVSVSCTGGNAWIAIRIRYSNFSGSFVWMSCCCL